MTNEYFEVEKKFLLTQQEQEKLLSRAVFVGEKTFTDTYYDTGSFDLTTKDIWLRTRGENWELKLPLSAGPKVERTSDKYQEISDKDIIDHELYKRGISNYEPFCTCTTKRKKYSLNDFTVDIDIASAENGFLYSIVEIEKVVNDKDLMDQAEKDILGLAIDLGIKEMPVRGKVLEYLKLHRPHHYEALVTAGIVKDY